MRRLWLVVALALISASGIAQRGFHAGVSAAFNSTWIVNQNNFETLSGCSDVIIQTSELAYEYTFGYSGALALGYKWNDRWGFGGELGYLKTGQKYQDGFTTSFCPEYSDVRRQVDLSYFQVPLLFKFTPGEGNTVRFYTVFGMQLNFLVSSKEQVWISGIPKTNFQVDADEKFKGFDFGIPAGVGVDIFLKYNVFFNAGLRMYYGLTDINGVAVQDFVSKNDVEYQKSNNFIVGLNVGIHYMVVQRYRRSKW